MICRGGSPGAGLPGLPLGIGHETCRKFPWPGSGRFRSSATLDAKLLWCYLDAQEEAFLAVGSAVAFDDHLLEVIRIEDGMVGDRLDAE